jgi:hypothetical protein
LRRASRRAFLTECLAALPAARVGVLASQVDARRAPRAREPIERIPLGRIGARLRATYRDLPAHFIFEYYPWYGTSPWRHWDEGGRKPPGQIASNYLPALGPYDSLDTRVIEQHAKWIRDAGAGAINMSWWGRGSYEDRAVPVVMDVMRAFGIQVTFHIEPYDDRPMRLADDITYLLREYGERRHWDNFLLLHRADGTSAPLMKLFASILPPTTTDCRGITRPVSAFVPDAVWRAQTRKLKQEIGSEFEGFTLLADSLDLTRTIAGGFDGGTSADPYFHEDAWSAVTNAFDGRDLVFVFGVNAGFDVVLPLTPPDDPCYRPPRVEPDGSVDWSSDADRAREGAASAARIRDSFEATLRLQTTPRSANARQGFFAVYLNSFNEWHEGTQFEPMVPFADLTSAERATYHNAVDGSYRLQTLRGLIDDLGG